MGTILGGVVAGPLGAAVGGVVGKCSHQSSDSYYAPPTVGRIK